MLKLDSGIMDMLWSLAEHHYSYIKFINYSHLPVLVFTGTQGERQKFGWTITRISTMLLCPQPVMCPMASKCVTFLNGKYYCLEKSLEQSRTSLTIFNMRSSLVTAKAT